MLRECPFPRATKNHCVAEDGEELKIALCNTSDIPSSSAACPFADPQLLTFSHASHISLIGFRASFLPSLLIGAGGQLHSIGGGVMHVSGFHFVEDSHSERRVDRNKKIRRMTAQLKSKSESLRLGIWGCRSAELVQ